MHPLFMTNDNKEIDSAELWKKVSQQLSSKKYEEVAKAAYKSIDLSNIKKEIEMISRERINSHHKLADHGISFSSKGKISSGYSMRPGPKDSFVELYSGKYLKTPAEKFYYNELQNSIACQPTFDILKPKYVRFCSENSALSDEYSHLNQTRIITPSWFPKCSLQILSDPTFFTKFDLDTLFFIFYFFRGTIQQTYAAIRLKKEAWRFHLKYKMWFQRLDEPKLINSDYEKGEFLFFDYETTWNFMKKNDFVFEYCYLEHNEHY